jgi:fused signal recognition particle receptor
MGIFSKFSKDKKETLDKGLEKTKTSIFTKLSKAVAGKSHVDDDVLDRLEETLVTSDVGVETTLKIIERLQSRVAKDKYISTSELNSLLKDEIAQLLQENKAEDTVEFSIPIDAHPYVIMVVGVNGVGKTTTIGKLAYNFRKAGKTVLLGAADTFRAAAIDQLKIWAQRADVPIISQSMGSDPASVAYDTVKSAMARDIDVVIIELSKIRNVMQKLIPQAPHEVLLILDASTGQNAIEQARQFTAATEVNAIALTKLDGTAKGGVVIGISDQFKIPVKYIGIGEKIGDLQLFNRAEFVDSLFT